MKHAGHEIVFEERWCEDCGTDSNSNVWAFCVQCGEYAEGFFYRGYRDEHRSDDSFHLSADGALTRLGS